MIGCLTAARPGRSLLTLVLVLVAVPSEGVARTWRASAGIATELIFSDNILLTERRPESDAVLRLEPRVSARRQALRLNSSINYRPSVLFYAGNSDLDRVQHVLDAIATAEVIERYLFFDVRARANQALLQPSDRPGARENRGGVDAIANPEAFTQTFSLALEPRVELPVIGRQYALLRVQPGFGGVFLADGGDGRDRRTNTSDTVVELLSGPRFTTIPWSVRWQQRLLDIEEDQRNTRLDGRIGYIFGPRYRLWLSLGYEETSFNVRDSGDGGLRWELRLELNPRSTTAIDIGVGQTFFGDTFSLGARHRHKRWALAASYDVSIQNLSTTILEQEVVPLQDPFGNPFVDPLSGNVLAVSLTTPVLTDDTFVRHQARLSVGYQRPRTAVLFDWTMNRREYDRADFDSTLHELRLNMQRQLSRRLTGSAELRYLDQDESGALRGGYQQDSIELALNYRLGTRATLTARLLRQDRSGDGLDVGFTEHRATVGVGFDL